MKIPSLLTALLLPGLALLGCASPPTATDQTAASGATTAPPVIPAPEVKPDPKAVLKRMGGYVRSLERFSVRVERVTELVLDSGQRLHGDQSALIHVRKPDGLRVNFENLSGGRQLFYDGKTFSLYTPSEKVYGTASAPGTLDETLEMLETHYGIYMPVVDLLRADPESVLVQNLQSATYVGLILVRGVPCHHLAFQTPDLDWEIWIEDGPRPLPRRLVITDKGVDGSPQLMANLSDWNLAPRFAADLFTFMPPPDAQAIQFLDQEPVAQAAQ